MNYPILLLCLHLFAQCALASFGHPYLRTPNATKQTPSGTAQGEPAAPQQTLRPTPRIRPQCPVRLGGVFTLDLGSSTPSFEDSAHSGVKLSRGNLDWLASHCDLVALNAINITPDTFPLIRQSQRLFTPLLYVYGSTLYENDNHSGNVGGWKPEMRSWTLRDRAGVEVPHPDHGAHWMDFANTEWAQHWKNRVAALTARFGADGVVVAELPIGNTFVPRKLQRYRSLSDRTDATTAWLTAARRANSPNNTSHSFLTVPSARGFDGVSPRATLPPPISADEPELHGRLWDEFNPLIDGAWSEGWIHPYWTDVALPEKYWEIEVEAAERFAFQDQTFIAAVAYRNDAELEFALATYLLASHRQGRFVFQPMPIRPHQREDAGFSLAVMRREVNAKPNYFNVPLGFSVQQRHLVPVDGGSVWRRAYENGVVYVNSSDQITKTLSLGGIMKRLNGARVRAVTLPPHSGVILLFE